MSRWDTDSELIGLPPPDPQFRITDPRIQIKKKYLRIHIHDTTVAEDPVQNVGCK